MKIVSRRHIQDLKAIYPINRAAQSRIYYTQMTFGLASSNNQSNHFNTISTHGSSLKKKREKNSTAMKKNMFFACLDFGHSICFLWRREEKCRSFSVYVLCVYIGEKKKLSFHSTFYISLLNRVVWTGI